MSMHVKLIRFPAPHPAAHLGIDLVEDEVKHLVPTEKGLIKIVEAAAKHGLGLDVDGDTLMVFEGDELLGNVYVHSLGKKYGWFPADDEGKRLVYHSEEFVKLLDDIQDDIRSRASGEMKSTAEWAHDERFAGDLKKYYRRLLVMKVTEK